MIYVVQKCKQVYNVKVDSFFKKSKLEMNYTIIHHIIHLPLVPWNPLFHLLLSNYDSYPH